MVSCVFRHSNHRDLTLQCAPNGWPINSLTPWSKHLSLSLPLSLSLIMDAYEYGRADTQKTHVYACMQSNKAHVQPVGVPHTDKDTHAHRYILINKGFSIGVCRPPATCGIVWLTGLPQRGNTPQSPDLSHPGSAKHTAACHSITGTKTARHETPLPPPRQDREHRQGLLMNITHLELAIFTQASFKF